MVALPIFNTKSKFGEYPIEKDGKNVGKIDIAEGFGQTYVTVRLIDAFLTIEELQSIMNWLETHVHIPKHQRIAFEQM